MKKKPGFAAGFRSAIQARIDAWDREGIPGRDALLGEAEALKKSGSRAGLWKSAPTMLTATIDDGIGQGIDLIGRFAAAVGVRVVFAGLLAPPARIADEARRVGADLAGLTVLQLDSEPVLAEIARGLPAGTVLVAGGPAFRLDPDLADRTGVDLVAANVAEFLRFLLGYAPPARQGE